MVACVISFEMRELLRGYAEQVSLGVQITVAVLHFMANRNWFKRHRYVVGVRIDLENVASVGLRTASSKPR